MLKFVINFIFVVCCFVLFESLLYYKDYNDLINIKKYVEYELKRNNFPVFMGEKFEIIIKENMEYTILLERESMFAFSKYKKIKYDGIVS